MSKGIPLNVLWDALDEKYKFIAKDGVGEVSERWYAYTLRPIKSEISEMWAEPDGGVFFGITLPIDAMHDVPWDQTIIERPIPIQAGAFGKFWDGDVEPKDKEADWGYLISTEDEVNSPYEARSGWWTHFIPKIPAPLIEM